jgi:hypothetical protein
LPGWLEWFRCDPGLLALWRLNTLGFLKLPPA